MSIVKLELEVSSEEILKAVEQLHQPDLEKFVSQVIILHTQKKSAKLLKDEVEFFLHNHHNLYSDTPIYCHQLISRTEDENLTEEEYRELLRLSEQIDKLQAQRLEYLAELAHLHGISLMELMQNLGFQT
ncbi:STAS/SEC14 domain-containing protein [Sphaerospermopsis aphanizomenoides BCCUSP55]|uniref:STAS/SEC14 domain-containing protein n=1 Tax=Sphaerospermopsis aphanizomenoides TaxID=459663 RepID=UPI001903CC2D|nr:STAS/SEC14 domain-containing protein [Sphaerospermopsis aphanizomenoides]MBK1989818.1 STAS/SEC14 domain-containing protein [Sphaerospermopsis aphanizomenoides BCCUSP55]